MRVLSYFAPENPWFSAASRHDVELPPESYTDRCEDCFYEDWQDWYSEPQTYRKEHHTEIPIQTTGQAPYPERRYGMFHPTEFYNMNNSSQMRRRPLRLTRPQQTQRSPRRDEIIDLDKEEDVTRHVTKNNSNKVLKLTPDPRNVEFTSKSRPIEIDIDRSNSVGNDAKCNDSDEENDINKTSSYAIYDYLKVLLQSSGRQIDCMRGDGNCFFRALSKIIYGSQKFYNDVRQAIVDLIEKKPGKFEAFTDKPIASHIKDMREDKTWATQTEIYAAATLLNKDIYVLSPVQSEETYKWLFFTSRFKYRSDLLNCECYITLCHTHGNHYDRIAPLGGTKKCNCHLAPPELSGTTDSVDLTNEDEIV